MRQNVSGYLTILGVSFLFAMFASELAFFYLYLGGISRYPENIVVSSCIILVFSLAGGLFANNRRISINVAAISTFTLLLSALYLIEHKIIAREVFGYSFSGFSCSIFLSSLTSEIYDFIMKKKIGKRHVLYLIVLTAIGIVLYAGYPYFYAIVTYFDQHPWIATVLGIAISLIGGYFLGKRGKK